MSEKQSNSVMIDSDDAARDQTPPEWSAKEERSLVRRYTALSLIYTVFEADLSFKD
ncbi:hypothetical protein FALCPG4_011218 [Fusarium falciforme]